MTGQKAINMLVDENTYKRWKDQDAKARIIFERGLLYPQMADQLKKYEGLLEGLSKSHNEVMAKKDLALEHMKGYFEQAELERDNAIKTATSLREENMRLIERLKELAPRANGEVTK